MRLAPFIVKKSSMVITFLLILSIFWGYWLAQSVKNFYLEKNRGIGQLSYLTNDVSRRSAYLPFWQPIFVQSSIDHLDEVNTNQSNLTMVSMNDGTVISLGNNSLLTLKRWRQSYHLSLTTGSLSIKNNIYPLQIETEQGAIVLKPMTHMSIVVTPEVVVMTILEGKVQIKELVHGNTTIRAGQQVKLKQGFAIVEPCDLQQLKPFLHDLYYTDSSLTAVVDFKLNHPIEREDRIEISHSSLFIDQIITIEPQGYPLSLSTRLDAGHYFWRYHHNSCYSETGSFIVAPLVAPQLLTPNSTHFKRTSDLDAVMLYWEDNPLYPFYSLELSTNSLFTGDIERYGVESSPLSLYHLADGHYFYRIIGEMYDKTGQAFSEGGEFIVSTQQDSDLKTLIPPMGATLNALQEKAELFFNWEGGWNIEYQELVIDTNANLASPFIRHISDNNFVNLLVPTDKVQTFYWRIEATTQKGEKLYSNVSSYQFTSNAVINSPINNDEPTTHDRRPIVIENEAKPSDAIVLKLLQPPSNSRINTIEIDRIIFRWQGLNAVLVDFELSDKQDFSTLVNSKKNLQNSTTTIAPPPPGRYYWRLRYTSKGQALVTEAVTFTIEWSLPPINLLSPQKNSSFYSNEASRGLVFEWKAPQSKNFSLTIAQDELFTQPIFSHQGNETTITLPPLKDGKYYAKIEGTARNGSNYPATTHEFSIEPYRPAAPISLSPDKKIVINMTNQDNLLFSWVASDEVTDHTLTLYKLDASLPTGRQTLHTKTLIKENVYRFNRLTQLSEGDFYWTIQSFVHLPSSKVSTSSTITEGFFSLSLDALPAPLITSPLVFRLSESPSQRISWNAIDNASRYHIIISTNDERQVKVIDTVTASLFITPRLAARAYRISITALTKFGKASASAATTEITVEP